jgi:hypothetical protein
MSGGLSGSLWFLIGVVMVMALGVAIIYGTRQWGGRGRPRGPMSEREAQRVPAEDRDAVKRAYEEGGDSG